jgi:hypothetical protein
MLCAYAFFLAVPSLSPFRTTSLSFPHLSLSRLTRFVLQMRRWSLARLLRARQRDWSPLPLTLSTTNAQLMRNYLDGEVAAHNGDGTVEGLQAARKGEASLRWRLRETEVRLLLLPFFALY